MPIIRNSGWLFLFYQRKGSNMKTKIRSHTIKLSNIEIIKEIAGNVVTVPVISAIGQRLLDVEIKK